MIKTILKRFIIVMAVILILLIIIPAIAFNVSPFAGSMIIRLFFEHLPKQPFEDPIFRDAVQVSYDIPYGDSGDETFDLYIPKSNDKQYPLIIWIHGGAFVGGDKKDVVYLAEALAYNGYAVASINYTRAPEASYPVPIRQLSDACEFLINQTYTDSDKIDTEHIFLAGDSAGAHVAAVFSLLQTNLSFREQFLKTHRITDFTSQINLMGTLLYCGPYSVKRFERISNPVLKFMVQQAGWAYFGNKNPAKGPFADEIDITANVTADFPPTYITDGNLMSFADHGKDLAARLSELGVYVESLFFPTRNEDIPHEFQFDLTSAAGMVSLGRTIAFLNKNYQNEQ